MRSAMLVPDAESFSFFAACKRTNGYACFQIDNSKQHLARRHTVTVEQLYKGIQKQEDLKGNLFQQKQRRNPLMMMVYLIR